MTARHWSFWTHSYNGGSIFLCVCFERSHYVITFIFLVQNTSGPTLTIIIEHFKLLMPCETKFWLFGIGIYCRILRCGSVALQLHVSCRAFFVSPKNIHFWNGLLTYIYVCYAVEVDRVFKHHYWTTNHNCN